MTLTKKKRGGADFGLKWKNFPKKFRSIKTRIVFGFKNICNEAWLLNNNLINIIYRLWVETRETLFAFFSLWQLRRRAAVSLPFLWKMNISIIKNHTKQTENLSMTAPALASLHSDKRRVSRREVPFFHVHPKVLSMKFPKFQLNEENQSFVVKDFEHKKKYVIDTIINRLDCYLTIINSLSRRPIDTHTQHFSSSASFKAQINSRNRQLNMRFVVWISHSLPTTFNWPGS